MGQRTATQERPRVRNGRRAGAIVAALAMAAMALAMLPAGTAHDAGRSDEHGTILLHFEQENDVCRVFVEARNVDVQHATLREEGVPVGPGDPVVHAEEELEGEPEDDHGFRFEAGPFEYEAGPDPDFPYPIRTFVLQWEGHSLSASWGGGECASDPYLRVHEDEGSGAVLTVFGCTFFVEGRHIRAAEGTVHVRVSGDPDDPGVAQNVTTEDTVSEEEGPGHRFFVGPMEMDESARYSVSFRDAQGETETGTSLRIDVVDCPHPPPEGCPDVNFRAIANEDQSITIVAEGLDRPAELHRVEAGSDDFVHVADLHSVPDHAFLDKGTESGTTYTYRLVVNSEVCEELEVTSIPFFTGAIMVLAALGVILVGYAAARRRG